MIAASVLSIITVAFSQFVSHQLRTLSFMEDKFSKIEFETFINQQLANPDFCLETLQGETPPSINTTKALNNIKDQDGTVILDPTDTSKNSYEKLIITELNLLNVSVPSSANSSGQMKLLISTERTGTGGGPKAFKPIEVLLNVSTDSGGTVASCTSSAKLTEICVEARYQHEDHETRWDFSETCGQVGETIAVDTHFPDDYFLDRLIFRIK
jgi:hypothetical protein